MNTKLYVAVIKLCILTQGSIWLPFKNTLREKPRKYLYVDYVVGKSCNDHAPENQQHVLTTHLLTTWLDLVSTWRYQDLWLISSDSRLILSTYLVYSICYAHWNTWIQLHMYLHVPIQKSALELMSRIYFHCLH